MLNLLQGIGSASLLANCAILVLGGVSLLLRGLSSRDAEIRAASFGALKGAGIGAAVFVISLLPATAVGMGFQANVSLEQVSEWLGVTTIPLAVTLYCMIRGYHDA